MFKLGLVINPIAGIGGSVALKGSDGKGIAEKALLLGAEAKANERTKFALEILLPYKDNITIFTANHFMGEQCATALGFTVKTVYQSTNNETDADDTIKAVSALIKEKVDLLLFAGGDGTARDICQRVNDHFPVLGIPAGCKIHSGVYAVTPKAAGRVVEMMITNKLVTLSQADVMDIDEGLFRNGIVKAKRYGEMQTPSELTYMQAVKSGGKESDELVLQDIAADIIDKMDDELFIIGSGSTTAFLMDELSLTNTLLGVDVIQHQQVIANDVTEQKLWDLLVNQSTNLSAKPSAKQSSNISPNLSQNKNYPNKNSPIKNINVKLVITLIGGQGHIFGRGNQQLSARIIRAIGKENIIIIATKAKLTALNSKPLIVDTGDIALDNSFNGYLPVITGYNDSVLYAVTSPQ